MNLLQDISELIKAGVITEETADKIREYYKSKSNSGSSTNRLFIVFGVLGAILVGLGIILIIAHNWDELSRGTKTVFAFLPPLLGQLLCGYVLLKKLESVAWRESASAFLFFAVGASIALVSQIYNIPGGTGTFILTWMLLSLPLIYLMNSSVTSLLYIFGISYYAISLSYWTYPFSDSYLYWLMLLGVLPHYYILFKKKPDSNFMIFHDWIIPLSVVITLGTLSKDTGELMFIAYFSLFGLLYLAGDLDLFAQHKPRISGYKILGSLGTIILLLMLSFDWFWEELRGADLQVINIIAEPEFIAALILSALAAGLLYVQIKNKAIFYTKPLAFVFLLFILTFILGLSSPIAALLINIYVLAVGIIMIRDGAMHDQLGTLNYGLLVITALVICRFFDTELSFVIRGILFLIVGAGFFAANYFLLKKRTINE